MSFQQGLSGLNTSGKALDVIGNNVANAATVGFKGSRAEFADLYAASLSGGGAGDVGIGAKLAVVAQQFTQGNVTTTNNSLDMAINGQGFFRLSQNGAVTYSRNGQFKLDASGYIVNNAGRKVQGYLADSAGNIVTSSPTDLQLNTADLTPNATANVTVGLNLDSRAAINSSTFDPNDSTTYTRSTSLSIYDSLGNAHVGTLYFQKSAANTWNQFLTIDGTQVTLAPTALTFDTNGTLLTPAGGTVTAASFTPTTPAGASPINLTFDFSNTSQYGSAFGVNKLDQDGYASGRLSGFNIDSSGIIKGRYTNGQSRNLGQFVLTNFANPQGLQPLGNNEWAETTASGTALVGEPGTSSLGLVQSAAVEDSNVDLTQELVGMITMQRVYQANAQTIKTQDQVLQTLVNLR